MSSNDPTPGDSPAPPLKESVVYISTQGTSLRYRDGRFEVIAVGDRRQPAPSLAHVSQGELDDDTGTSATNTGTETGETLASLPEHTVESVNVFGRGVNVTSGARRAAASNDILINYFTLNGAHQARFVPSGTRLAVLHEQQHALETQQRLAVSSSLLRGKIGNARTYLQRHDAPQAVIDDLGTALEKLQRATSLDELRGIEGQAARVYFDAYDTVLAEGWTMDGRSRRPPGDHVNSLLSLTYTFLQQRAEAALRAVNLDPYVGVFHTERHGRPALALDLLEEFRRSFADSFVLQLINQQVVSHGDFTETNELSDTAFDDYLAAFDDHMEETLQYPALDRTLTRREVIHVQARLLRKTITDEVDRYRPFEIQR